MTYCSVCTFLADHVYVVDGKVMCENCHITWSKVHHPNTTEYRSLPKKARAYIRFYRHLLRTHQVVEI